VTPEALAELSESAQRFANTAVTYQLWDEPLPDVRRPISERRPVGERLEVTHDTGIRKPWVEHYDAAGDFVVSYDLDVPVRPGLSYESGLPTARATS